MLHVHEERTKQAKTQEGCGGCERLQWGGRKFSPFQHFQDKILAVTWDNIIIGSEKKTFVFANMQTDDCGSIGS